MSTHGSAAIERHCDVLIVGGSAAGLSAALHLGRERRSVIVVDAGEGRNAPAAPVHGDLGPEGAAPSVLTGAGRDEVRSYGGEILAGRVVSVTSTSDGQFRAELAGGHSVVARRVLAEEDRLDAHSAAAGSRAGASIASSLAHDDLVAASRPSAHESDWDHRYQGRQMWSGNPNGSLVNEALGLTPGRALDIGAGEGGDAIWLAEHGWTVTANDISARALERLRAEAERRGLDIDRHHGDVNAAEPFERAAYDLVSALYASIPRTPDDRGARNLLDAVAPNGILLIVSHDIGPMRGPIDTRIESRPFDPDAYLRTDDFARLLARTPGWDIEAHEKRPRPAGAASSHHVDDIILRARRRPHR